MDYKEYTKRAYDIATKHGFHDKVLPIGHFLMLAITEISEIVDADRKSKRAMIREFKRQAQQPQLINRKTKHWQYCFEIWVKDSFEDEMADVCIRLFDIAGCFHYDISPKGVEDYGNMYFATFPNKSVTQITYDLCHLLTDEEDSPEVRARLVLDIVKSWAQLMDIDLVWHIEQKMKYNELRPQKHGKKY